MVDVTSFYSELRYQMSRSMGDYEVSFINTRPQICVPIFSLVPVFSERYCFYYVTKPTLMLFMDIFYSRYQSFQKLNKVFKTESKLFQLKNCQIVSGERV